jgi:hypothetical protein
MARGDEEFWVEYRLFPWFKSATIEAICDVTEPVPGHFYWPTLDVDLDIENLRHPEGFPLIAR